MSAKSNPVDKTSMALDDIIKLEKKTKKANGVPKINQNRNIARKAKNNAIKNLNTRRSVNLNNSIGNKRNNIKANLNQQRRNKISPTKPFVPRNAFLTKGNRNVRQTFSNNSPGNQYNRPLQGLKITRSNENFNNQRRSLPRNNQKRGSYQRNNTNYNNRSPYQRNSITRTISTDDNYDNRYENYNPRYNDNFSRKSNIRNNRNSFPQYDNRNYDQGYSRNTRRSYDWPQESQYGKMAKAVVNAHARSRNTKSFNRPSSFRSDPYNTRNRRYGQ